MKKTAARTIAAAALLGVALGLSGVAHAETVGDPDDMAGWHVAQTYDDCALMATADVVGQMTGTAPSEEEIISYAKDTPSVAQPGDMIYDMGQTDDDPNAGTIFQRPADRARPLRRERPLCRRIQHERAHGGVA